jgi:hypothetical protein
MPPMNKLWTGIIVCHSWECKIQNSLASLKTSLSVTHKVKSTWTTAEWGGAQPQTQWSGGRGRRISVWEPYL